MSVRPSPCQPASLRRRTRRATALPPCYVARRITLGSIVKLSRSRRRCTARGIAERREAIAAISRSPSAARWRSPPADSPASPPRPPARPRARTSRGPFPSCSRSPNARAEARCRRRSPPTQPFGALPTRGRRQCRTPPPRAGRQHRHLQRRRRAGAGDRGPDARPAHRAALQRGDRSRWSFLAIPQLFQLRSISFTQAAAKCGPGRARRRSLTSTP